MKTLLKFLTGFSLANLFFHVLFLIAWRLDGGWGGYYLFFSLLFGLPVGLIVGLYSAYHTARK